MSKRGKEIKMDLSENYNIVYGTVDNKNAQAIYINISAWGEPTINDDTINYGRIISRLGKCVKQSTYNNIKNNHLSNFYSDRTIVDLDMRESGVKFGKRSFMNCEITIFRKDINNGVINDEPVTQLLTDIINESIDCLNSFKHFNFNKKKN